MNKPVAWINLEAWESGKYPPDDCFSDKEFIGSIPIYTHPVKELTDAIETLENLLDIADNGIREGYKTMNSHFVIEEIKQALFEIRKAQEK